MPTKGVTDSKPSTAESLDDGYLVRRVKYRGVLYVLKEVPIGKYDDLQRQATTEVENLDGTTTEKFDGSLRDRLLLSASIIEPAGVNLSKIGARVVANLTRIVNELHYFDEPDELKAENQQSADDEGDGDKKGEPTGNA